MLNKPLQLSILFHIMLVVVFMVVAKYQKPVTKIQVTLVSNVPSLSKENKAKLRAVPPKIEAPKKPAKKFNNIIIKNFKKKATVPKAMKTQEVLKPQVKVPQETKSSKTNVVLKNNKAPSKENPAKHIEDSQKVKSENLNSETTQPILKKDSIPTLNNMANEEKVENVVKKDPIPEDIPKDLEELDLSDADKQALAKNLSNCVAGLPAIREKDEVLFLSFKINEDAIVENVDIIRNNQKVPQEQLSNLEQRVVAIFQSKACSKLLLPPNDFRLWHEFSVKLRLEGFFNE